MTSSAQLRSVCAATPGFLGIFSADTMPDIDKDMKAITAPSFIVNYDDSDEPGSHWVAMRFPRGAPAEYFDSFGQPPDKEDFVLHRRTKFRQYLQKHSRMRGHFRYNDVDMQCLRENTCGEWSALFIILGGLPKDPRVSRKWKPLMPKNLGCAGDIDVRKVIGVR